MYCTYSTGSQHGADDEEKNVNIITTDHIKEGLHRSHLLYDRAGMTFSL